MKQSLRVTQPPSAVEIHLHTREGVSIVDRLANELRHAARFGQNDTTRWPNPVDEVLWMGLHPSANDNAAVTLTTGVSLRFLREEQVKGRHTLVLELALGESSDTLFYDKLRLGEASQDPGQGGGWSLVPVTWQNRLVITGADERTFSREAWDALGPHLIRRAVRGMAYEVRPSKEERIRIPLSPAAVQLGLPRAEAEPSRYWDAVFSVGNDVTITLADRPWGPQLQLARNTPI